MDFWELLVTNVIMKYIYGFSAAYVVYHLAGKKIAVVKLLLSLIVFAIVEGSIITVISARNIIAGGVMGLNSYALVLLVEGFLDFTYFAWLNKDLQKGKVLFLLVVSAVFTYAMMMVPEVFDRRTGILSEYLFNGYFAVALITLILTVAGMAILAKTKIIYYLRKLGGYPKIYITLGVLYYFLSIYFIYEKARITWWPILYMLLILGVAVLVRDIENQKTIKASQTLLLQQQSYVNRLEKLQRELRMIQHDHKNLVAGLYAQANDGDLEAVKTYIDTKLLKVDATVKEDIRQINQLTRIGPIELKGLVLTKIHEAERSAVSFHLEVMNQIEQPGMQIEDLLRCVGILLDNAIEEVRGSDEAAVTLLLLQERKKLSVVVDNPVRHQPDLIRIWREGYSTKGSGRGLGLSSFQNIIRKYPNVLHEAKAEGGRFTQVVTIMNVN